MRVRSLSIVIPTYNESARLSTTLDVLLDHTIDADVEIIVVDDGSSDGTADLARELLEQMPRAQVLELPENRGKGAAVRSGMAAARGDVSLFMDADLATDLEALDRVIDALGTADVVVGSRSVPGSVVHKGTRGRALMGRGFNRMVRILTRTDVHDTQCGFKAFRAPIARVLFGLSRINGFAFDAEILHFARVLGFRVAELPVAWTAVEGTSVRPVRDSLRAAFDLLQVTLRDRPAGVRARARALGWTPMSPGDAAPQVLEPPLASDG